MDRIVDDASQPAPPPLPTGVVTFLFTDIEGSTRLVTGLGPERYGEVLELHNRLLGEAVARHGGIEFGSEGDAAFVVFTDPAAAVAAAADGQRGLSAASWPHGPDPVRVRMGIHTGEAALAAGTYVGSTVNRAARIAATAHGGQVVLSSASRALIGDACPVGTRLRDLGEHRLKDLTEPERISQLVIVGLPADFPPLRSLEAVPNNLPAQLTSFIGRDADIAAVADLLRGNRLVVVTGPGGTGKTRLALQVAADIADRFAGGVWFVDLAPIGDPSLVGSTVADALGVSAIGARPIRDVLVERLRDQEALLVLDNFEQVVDAAPLIADLLREAPRLRALVTSRSVLRVSGEREVPLDALGLAEAVGLFVERAQAVRPGFALVDEVSSTIVDIVERLDRLPLAIELAAARSRLLTPAAMLARLDHRLDLLTGDLRDLPARQRTIRGAIAWSYDLLDEDLQRLFARLAVFVGGAAIDDVEAVIGVSDDAGLDVLAGLEALVEHSLIGRAETGEGARFTMLAVIREYALERMPDAGDDEDIHDRHATRFLELAEQAGSFLVGPERARWLERLDTDRENLRAALGHTIAGGESATALRLCAALWRYWQVRGYLAEGIRWTRDALALPDAIDHPVEHLAALDAAGGLTWWLGDYVDCEAYYRAALDGHLVRGDERSIAYAYYNLGFPVAFLGEPGAAIDLIREAQTRFARLGDQDGVARTRWGIGVLGIQSGDIELARRESAAAVDHFRGRDLPFDLGWALYGRGMATFKSGELDEAEAAWTEALRMFHGVGDLTGVAMLLDALATIAYRNGDHDEAARLAGAVARLEETTGTGLNPANRDLRGWDPSSLRDEPATQAAWQEGATRPVDEIVRAMLGSGSR